MTVEIIASVLVVSAISLVGVLYLAISLPRLEKLLFWLVSFAAGTLLGDVFLHLLPELVHDGFTPALSATILGGIIFFWIIEKLIHWRHCHTPSSEHHPHPLAFMNLIGDAFHNFLDGMIIAGSWLASPALGMATTIAVVFHEIPQEISDFGVLIHAGLSRAKAIIFNLFSALTALLGALLVIWLNELMHGITPWLIAITIGGFIYIATADLFPELKKDTRLKGVVQQFLGIAFGIAIMAGLLAMEAPHNEADEPDHATHAPHETFSYDRSY